MVIFFKKNSNLDDEPLELRLAQVVPVHREGVRKGMHLLVLDLELDLVKKEKFNFLLNIYKHEGNVVTCSSSCSSHRFCSWSCTLSWRWFSYFTLQTVWKQKLFYIFLFCIFCEQNLLAPRFSSSSCVDIFFLKKARSLLNVFFYISTDSQSVLLILAYYDWPDCPNQPLYCISLLT